MSALAAQRWLYAVLPAPPVAEALEQRNQLAARGAQRIGDGGRHRVGGPALHDPVRLELAQLFSLDLFTDAAQFPAQFRKAQRTEGEVPDDLDLPLSGHHVDGGLDRAAVMIASCCH